MTTDDRRGRTLDSKVRVRVDDLTILKTAVVARYGKLRGVLGVEVSRALREHAKRLEAEATA